MYDCRDTKELEPLNDPVIIAYYSSIASTIPIPFFSPPESYQPPVARDAVLTHGLLIFFHKRIAIIFYFSVSNIRWSGILDLNPEESDKEN